MYYNMYYNIYIIYIIIYYYIDCIYVRPRIKLLVPPFPLFSPKAKQGLVFCEGAPALCWKSNICSSKRPLSQESWAATTRKLHIQWPRELE